MSGRYIDFPSGSISDNEIQLVADPTTSKLFSVSLKQQKDYFQQGISTGSGFVSTSSFNTFSSSYVNDSSSFNTRINNDALTATVNNVFSSQSNYTPSSSFNNFSASIKTFTSSYFTDSASFVTKISATNIQIANVFASESNYQLTSSFNTFSSSYVNDSSSFNTRINSVTGSSNFSGSGFTPTSSFNPFTASYFTDSSSFNSRLNILSGSVAVSGGLTSMPLASNVGIFANGTNQISAFNTFFANQNYAGLILDDIGGGAYIFSGSLNCNGKYIKFISGSFISGSSGSAITNFVIDAGLRQKCFDIGPSASLPTITISPIGTTLDVVSPWWFGAKGDGVTDDGKAFQVAIDTCLHNGSKVSKIKVPTATYKIGNPLIVAVWNVSTYTFNLITIEGDNTFASADGFGSVLDFSSRKDSFGIGFHQTKGSALKNIKLKGGFNYTSPGAYTFYSQSFTAMTDGVSRDSSHSPNAGVIIDPFGPSIPVDGGYPGNDAYGNPLSGYYRGNSNGSTGVELEDIFFTNWVLCFICSPNGQTFNAELVNIWKCQINTTKIGFVSCQSQEKLNIARGIMSWNLVGCVFASAVGYGADGPGSWWIEDVNIAGLTNTFVFNPQSGFFPSYFGNIYAESLAHFGQITSNNATVVENSTINFTYYDAGGAFQYISDMISGQGYTFKGCVFRIYGTGNPVTINAINGPIFFDSCAFETVPIYNQDYGGGYCAFTNCNVGGAGMMLNPLDMSTVTSGNFSLTYGYGNNKINIGNAYTSTRKYNISAPVPATRFPINSNNARYTLSSSLSGSLFQTMVSCSSDELNRVFVGDTIVGDVNGTGTGLKVVGIVNATGSNWFSINSVSSWVTTGSLFSLYTWLPLKNISFTGDVTNGSNKITNVTSIDGTLSNFVNTTLSVYGGLLQTKSYKATNVFNNNMIRLTNFSGSTLTVDKNSTYTATNVLFTQGDATIDPGIPTFITGSAIGAAGIGSIIKGKDNSHQVSITTGTSTSTGVLGTVSFSFPYAAAYVPTVTYSSANLNALLLTGSIAVYMDAPSGSFYTINTGTSALPTSSTFTFNVQVN